MIVKREFKDDGSYTDTLVQEEGVPEELPAVAPTTETPLNEVLSQPEMDRAANDGFVADGTGEWYTGVTEPAAEEGEEYVADADDDEDEEGEPFEK